MTKLSIEWRHIDSHTGDALNDGADALADFGAKGNLKHLIVPPLRSHEGEAHADQPQSQL